MVEQMFRTEACQVPLELVVVAVAVVVAVQVADQRSCRCR